MQAFNEKINMKRRKIRKNPFYFVNIYVLYIYNKTCTDMTA